MPPSARPLTAPSMAEEGRGVQPPLLLHSLAEFRELIFACLEAAEARIVVEVGGEEGLFTGELLAWAESRDGAVYCVEPHPSSHLRQLLDASPAGHLVEARSPEALDKIEAPDAYLLDGDHNYYTVLNELEAIEHRAAARGGRAMAVLHDTGWPCARRDMYYDPQGLPPDAVHPYTYEQGVKVGACRTTAGGFRGEGRHAWALTEGGPGNGVLTAVEDFLREREELRFVKVPCIFGLGILYETTAPYASALDELLAVYDENPLLRRLEDNRLHLYLSHLGLQDELDECRRRSADLSAQNRSLSARVAELESHRSQLIDELELLVRSRALAVAERLSALRALGKAGPALSRQRLRETLDGVSDG